MKLYPGRIAATLLLTLGIAYWLNLQPGAPVIVVGLFSYGLTSGLARLVSRLF